jgi:hypothetical protein
MQEIERDKEMEKRFRYVIDKHTVWLELVENGVPMACKGVYTGTSKKDCEEWLKSHKKEEFRNAKKS